jgi:hypothetical protein
MAVDRQRLNGRKATGISPRALSAQRQCLRASVIPDTQRPWQSLELRQRPKVSIKTSQRLSSPIRIAAHQIRMTKSVPAAPPGARQAAGARTLRGRAELATVVAFFRWASKLITFGGESSNSPKIRPAIIWHLLYTWCYFICTLYVLRR